MQALQSLGCDSHGWVPPVVRTVAMTGEGIPALLSAVEYFLEARAAG